MLRDRDVLELGRSYLILKDGARELLGSRAISEEALDALRAHAWPGNVRELKATLLRSAALARGVVIEKSDLVFQAPIRAKTPALSLEAGGNQSRAERALGISRHTLIAKIRKYKLARPRAP